jgi:membrane protease YdiL (CAAX protease family)
VQILIPLGFNLGIFLLLHFVIGKYPPRLPASKNSRREILEALGLWLIVAIAVTVALILVPESELADPSFQTVLLTNLALLPFWVLIPLVFVLRVNRWSLRDAGFRKPISPPVLIFAVLAWGLIGVLQFIDPEFSPLPAWLVAMSLYQPAFTEEFLFRGVVQGKLERALGQNKAWFYSGILFGLMHASTNFFGQQWYRHGESTVNAIFLLVLQTIAGWVFGIMYTKSRSLLPSFLAHYFADGRLASILYYISAAIS